MEGGTSISCVIHYCHRKIVGALYRRLESQICVATGLAVHIGPSPVTVQLLVRELLRTCAVLVASTSELPRSHPPEGPAHFSSEGGFRGLLSSLANYLRPMRPTAICGGHIVRGGDRSALRRLDARGLGFPR